MTYISNKDFALEVAKGNVSKHSVELKFGRNIDIDTGTNEDVWGTGGTFVEPTAARIHSFVSTDSNDTVAGTGARTVYIEGLDASYNVISETISTLGLVAVLTVNSYTFINRMYVDTFGSGGTNAGVLTLIAAVDLTTQITISIGAAQSLKAIYMVPNGYKAYITAIGAGMYQATSNNSISILLYTKTFGAGGYRLRRDFYLTNSGTSTFLKDLNPYLKIPAKTIIKLRGETATANNTQLSGSFNMYLVQD